MGAPTLTIRLSSQLPRTFWHACSARRDLELPKCSGLIARPPAFPAPSAERFQHHHGLSCSNSRLVWSWRPRSWRCLDERLHSASIRKQCSMCRPVERRKTTLGPDTPCFFGGTRIPTSV